MPERTPGTGCCQILSQRQNHGATVGWPATFVGPGTSSLTCSPDAPTFEFHLGRLNDELDEKVYEVQAVLEKMCPGRVNLTKNLMADRRSKL